MPNQKTIERMMPAERIKEIAKTNQYQSCHGHQCICYLIPAMMDYLDELYALLNLNNKK